jgi:hypothetical protein
MTADPSAFLAPALAVVMGVFLASAAALRAWRQWLALKRLELAKGRPGRRQIAELRERVRRLEAIAGGIEN